MTTNRPWTRVAAACAIALSLSVPPAVAQSAPSPTVAEVRAAVAAARKATDGYKPLAAGAAADSHPALEWESRLWAFRERAPQSEAGALAAVETVWLLVRAELWDRVHARIASIGYDDPAWIRLAGAIYSEGNERNDTRYAIDALSRAAAATTSPTINAAVLVTLGRAHRRAADFDAAIRVLEAAKAAAPGTPQAEDAEGLLYEITYLRPGLPAPAVAGRTRNKGAVDLASLRGMAVVLVFWGST
jgi:hypothetical protein